MSALLYVLILLVPAAFASGWWTARRAGVRRSGAQVSELSSDYFRGLNYLLNEEQDKAIEVFLKLAEYNRDTVETHLALGNLFRRRGEVDRAIRLHQHLVSRPGLSDAMKTVALRAQMSAMRISRSVGRRGSGKWTVSAPSVSPSRSMSGVE